MTLAERRRRHRTGLDAETRAAWALRLKGYRILDRRLRTPVGEVDLVIRRGRVVALVEVKARADVARAVEAVTPRQRRRIERAAGWLLSARPDLARLDLRFDVVAVAPGRWPRHIADAWRPAG